MNSSNLYRIHPESKTLQSVREINFSDHNFRERYDIQEWIEETPSILGERLLIIAKEKTHFDGTRERPDLVAIDEEGNIVVIDLKRDDSGNEVHWQAIKYASYWSRFSVQDVLVVFAEHLAKHRAQEENEEIDAEYAKQAIVDFINQDTPENVNKRQRIILASHRFSREVISAVDWLIENYGLDIRCVELVPYFDEDKETYYLQSNVILPVGGIDEYLVKPSSGKAAAAKGSRGSRNDDEVTSFFERLRDTLLTGVTLPEEMKPTRLSRWAGSDYRFRYYHFWYKNSLWDNWELSYRIWLYNERDTNARYRNHVRIFLEIRKRYLLQNGITEKRVNELSRSLEETCEHTQRLEFRPEGDSLVVECVAPYTELNDELKETIISDLSVVISNTYNNVTEILEKERDRAG